MAEAAAQCREHRLRGTGGTGKPVRPVCGGGDGLDARRALAHRGWGARDQGQPAALDKCRGLGGHGRARADEGRRLVLGAQCQHLTHMPVRRMRLNMRLRAVVPDDERGSPRDRRECRAPGAEHDADVAGPHIPECPPTCVPAHLRRQGRMRHSTGAREDGGEPLHIRSVWQHDEHSTGGRPRRHHGSEQPQRIAPGQRHQGGPQRRRRGQPLGQTRVRGELGRDGGGVCVGLGAVCTIERRALVGDDGGVGGLLEVDGRNAGRNCCAHHVGECADPAVSGCAAGGDGGFAEHRLAEDPLNRGQGAGVAAVGADLDHPAADQPAREADADGAADVDLVGDFLRDAVVEHPVQVQQRCVDADPRDCLVLLRARGRHGLPQPGRHRHISARPPP